MTFNGYLSEFSLGEIFQLIEQGKKTGKLSIRDLFNHDNPKHYLWFREGRVIAASNRSDHKGLQALIRKRKWLKESAFETVYEFWNQQTPLGFHLKSVGALSPEQLKLLFITQIMQEVCTLFKIDHGFFQFETEEKPSTAEMTGLSKPATELTLVGLRMLKNWHLLAEKLPQPSSGLIRLIPSQPSYSLNTRELQVWGYAQGTTALKTIAQELRLPIEKVQQIAFGLIVIGLAEELPMIEIIPPNAEAAQSQTEETATPPAMSDSFLNQLTTFLQQKTSYSNPK